VTSALAARTLAPLSFVLLWASGFVFAKVALTHTEPITLLVLRYLGALLCLLPLVLVLRPAWPKSARELAKLAVIGFLMQGIFIPLNYLALGSAVSAATVGLITSLQPILVGILAPRLLGEAVDRRQWLGLLLGLAGTAMVILSRGSVMAQDWLGLLFAFSALAALTLVAITEKRLAAQGSLIAAAIVQFSIGLCVVTPLALASEPFTVRWSIDLAWALAAIVVGNSLASISLLLWMIRRGAVARVSALFFLVPPATALFAWSLLGEDLNWIAWLGMAVAAVGVATALNRRIKQE